MSGKPKKRGFWTFLQSGSAFAESRRHASLNCDEGGWSGANFLSVIWLKTNKTTSYLLHLFSWRQYSDLFSHASILNLQAFARQPHNLFSCSISLSFLNSVDHLSVSLGLFCFVSSFQDCIKSCLPYAAADVPTWQTKVWFGDRELWVDFDIPRLFLQSFYYSYGSLSFLRLKLFTVVICNCICSYVFADVVS